jgi:hypothetical protein
MRDPRPECSLNYMRKMVSYQHYERGRKIVQAVAIGYSKLKKACGCTSKRRLTPSRIITCGLRSRRRRRRR